MLLFKFYFSLKLITQTWTGVHGEIQYFAQHWLPVVVPLRRPTASDKMKKETKNKKLTSADGCRRLCLNPAGGSGAVFLSIIFSLCWTLQATRFPLINSLLLSANGNRKRGKWAPARPGGFLAVFIFCRLTAAFLCALVKWKIDEYNKSCCFCR